MRLLLVFLFSILTHQGFSQKWSFEYWHDGKIILEGGDTLKGQVKYDFSTDVIQLNQNNQLQSLTARKIVYFEIFDAVTSRYRQFYSIPFAARPGYKTPVFFELLAEGKLTLLARETLEYKTTNSGYYGYGSFTRLVLVDKYYTLSEKGDVEEFSGKRNDLLALMGKREDDVKKFIKANRIDLEYKYDLARVINHYNSFFKTR